MKKSIFFLMAMALVVTSGCASRNKAKKLAYLERPAEIIYLEGFDRLGKHDWSKAILHFDDVERQHPYSEWARRAMLMSAYASYESGKYDEAVASAGRFVALHPGSASAPYAYYLIGICHFEQIRDVGRDQGKTTEALNALRQVLRRFPNSDYARDARLKIDLTLDQLAGKDMSVGRYYQRKGNTLAAINRFRNVATQYQTTAHAPEALHRLVESYVRLGIMQEAVQVAAVLGYNYPGSEWYEDSYRLLAKTGGPNAVAALDETDPEKRKNFFRRSWNRLF
ncbi:MAG: outer membrane protein assembly factor BamD [Robiginitomaculum sp.]|nr:MAG: outer membrane protein assembly factor BamD [Robiginitomaculum sp.]